MYRINTVIGQFRDNSAFGQGVYYTTTENMKQPNDLFEGDLTSKGKLKAYTFNFAHNHLTE
jgi:hypothetical protein